MGVAELAIERRRDGGGQEIRGDHPGKMLEIAELAPDGRQRGGDDGLVERGQQQRHHEADDDRADLGAGVSGGPSAAVGWGASLGPSHPSFVAVPFDL